MEISSTSNKQIHSTTTDINVLLKLYLDSLTEKELKSYAIAKSHLGTSFQLEKSLGFLKWKSEYIPNISNSFG